MMDSAILYAIIALFTVSVQGEGTCKVCNCQLNNVQVLDQLIESKIASGKLAMYVPLYSYK